MDPQERIPVQPRVPPDNGVTGLYRRTLCYNTIARLTTTTAAIALSFALNAAWLTVERLVCWCATRISKQAHPGFSNGA